MPMLVAWTVAVASLLLGSASFGSSWDQSLPPMCPSLSLEAAFGWSFVGVSENSLVYPEKPNGFADHDPYEKWLFHWEY